MAKISERDKKKYAERIRELKAEIEIATQRQQKAIQLAQSGNVNSSYQKIMSANENINLISYYLLMNGSSRSLLGIKNEGFLNEARKQCYKSIIDVEEVVTAYIDVPFSSYEEKVATIDAFSDRNKLRFLRKLGFAIDSVQEEYGVSSKWRWSFVELDGRFAAISKNLLNLKTFIGKMDPRVDGYESRMAHLKLARQMLQKAADRYHEKYELATHRLDDMKLAMSFLAALRRLSIVMGDAIEAEVIKKKVEVWKAKLAADMKKGGKTVKK